MGRKDGGTAAGPVGRLKLPLLQFLLELDFRQEKDTRGKRSNRYTGEEGYRRTDGASLCPRRATIGATWTRVTHRTALPPAPDKLSIFLQKEKEK